MKLLYFFLPLFLLLTFQGCSTQQAGSELPPQQVQTDSNISDDLEKNAPDEQGTDDQIEEFEEEFSEQETDAIDDPFDSYNRWMTSFNDNVIIYALNPVSEAYAYVLPKPLRIGVSNFIDNLRFPVRFVNNLLQGKFQNSSDELERFIINSTVGLAGLMDPATNAMTTPIPAHSEDFGQTLGHYGMSSGYHLVLPFLGPSNIRDILGLTGDMYLSPLVNVRGLENYKIPQNFGQSVGVYTIYLINRTSLHLGEYESLKEDAIDLYPFLRDVYEQKRTSDIAE